MVQFVMTRRPWFLAVVFLTGLSAGAVAHRHYRLVPHNHWLKSGVQWIKGEAHDHGAATLTPLQSWHVETAEAISFAQPEDAPWLIAFNRNNWNKSDNANFLFLANAAGASGPVAVTIAAECHPAMTLADFRAFDATYRDLVVRFTFPDPAPPLPALTQFAQTGFHESLKPAVQGNAVIVRLPTHPVIVDDLVTTAQVPASLDQRGQIGHFYTLLALEIFAWSRGIDPGTLPGPRVIYANDRNSARNHAVINQTAALIRRRLEAR